MLLSAGHAEAREYVIAMVWSEARLVRQRQAEDLRKQAIATQLAVATSNPFGETKKVNKLFKDFLDGLDDGY